MRARSWYADRYQFHLRRVRHLHWLRDKTHMYYDFLDISILTPWAARFGRSAEGGLARGRVPYFRAPALARGSALKDF